MSALKVANNRRRSLALPLLILAAACLSAGGGCGTIAAQGENAQGVRLFEEARYQQALQKFHKAINCDPKNADGYYNLASTYHRLGTLEGDESKLSQAEQYYRMCHDRDPNHQQCYRGLAVLLIERGRSQEAFRLMEDWVDRQPTLAAPKIELARLFEEFGDPDTAKAHLLDALAIDHDNPRALAALGRLREQAGQQGQALADYQRSLWCDRFQPEVAARVAALRSTLTPTVTVSYPAADTRIVTRGPTTIR